MRLVQLEVDRRSTGMENQLTNVVVEYTKRILFGLVTIEFIVIDRRPDFKQYEYLRKFLNVTSVYVVGFKVFETEVLSNQIGSANIGFCLEKDPINVTQKYIEQPYKQAYSEQNWTPWT